MSEIIRFPLLKDIPGPYYTRGEGVASLLFVLRNVNVQILNYS